MKKSAKKPAPSSSPSETASFNLQQSRLDRYFPHITQSSKGTLTENEQKEAETKSKINQLETKVRKLAEDRDRHENKCSILSSQYKKYKRKSRESIVQMLKEKFQKIRQERRLIQPQLGYFNSNREYIEGFIIPEIKRQIEQKQEKVQLLKVKDKKTKDLTQKPRIQGAINFISSQLVELQAKLQVKQKELSTYKERLRLAEKEKNCYYGQLEWPIIQDTKENDRYLPLQLLGKGGFGEVYKCYDLQQHDFVALKIINIDMTGQLAENTFKHVKRQVQIHSKLKHKNIAEITELLELSRSKIRFVLEYCSGSELSVYLRKHKSLDEKEAKQIIHQLFYALEYLSKLPQKVIHYDLKPSNLIFKEGIVKIIDFGLCKQMQSEESRMQLTSAGVGTYWYLPPQTFDTGIVDISEKVDVWSVGVIFYELLFGKRPFGNGMSQQKIYQKNAIVNEAKQLKIPEKTLRGSKVGAATKKFIEKCLAYDAEDRFTPSEALNHDYFKF